MFKFVDDTKFCHRAKNPDDITEQQEDISINLLSVPTSGK